PPMSKIPFFFQAEDGIRDRNVTGVQTCALPIYDDGYLTKFPGIGKKTAKQIILDLKGKLSDVDSDMLTGQDNLDLDLNASSPYLKESLVALRALGYTKTEVRRISKKLEKYDGKSTDDYLRQGLR